MKKVIGVAAGLTLLPYPDFAVLLFLLWLFWEDLGTLALSLYDDYQLAKTEKALSGSLNADAKAFYVHMLTIRSVTRRERRARQRLARKRKMEAAYAAFARTSAWFRLLTQKEQTAPIGAAIEEP